MIIYPTIELKDGKCATLYRGREEEASYWHVDPIATVQKFSEAGARWIHMTDLDAVFGTGDNSELVQDIIHKAGASVQLGGGMRTREQIESWIDRGAGRVVVGTLAVQDSATVKELAMRYPDQISVAIDVFQGKLMTDGWRNSGALEPEAFVTAYEDVPLAGIIVTDIDADIGDQDGQLGVISGVAAATRHPVVARGTVHTTDDISRLKYVSNIAGTLVGKALFAKDVDLGEALAIAQPQPEAKAEFI